MNKLKYILILIFFYNLNAQELEKNYFSELEANMFQSMIDDEINTIFEEGEAELSENGFIKLPKKVTADKLQKEYEKNEVKADIEYGGKVILVTGKVDSIQKDIGGRLLVKITGGSNMFIMPTAQIQKKHINWVASLNKKDNIKVVCKNDGFIIGMVSLSECIPFKSWLEGLNIMNKILSYYKENQNTNNEMANKIGQMIEFTKILATKIDPNKSSCNTSTYDSNKCLNEMSKIVAKMEKEKKANK